MLGDSIVRRPRVRPTSCRGAEPQGLVLPDSFARSCLGTGRASCIERDETLEAIGIAPGPYAVNVSALGGTLQCGSGEDVMLVPANGSAIKPIQIAPVRNFGC
jgi:hypothetical protein